MGRQFAFRPHRHPYRHPGARRSAMKSPQRKVPNLLKNWGEVAKKIRAHRRVTVFLDFDGTLVAIAPHPDKVRLTPAARKILRRLARHPQATVVVVSGRR